MSEKWRLGPSPKGQNNMLFLTNMLFLLCIPFVINELHLKNRTFPRKGKTPEGSVRVAPGRQTRGGVF